MTYDGDEYSWTMGRRLAGITKADGTEISYTYNADGIRTSKTVDGVTYNYVLEGDKLVQMSTNTGEVMWFSYDASGSLIGFRYEPAVGSVSNYYYMRNAQGDITGFYSQSGRIGAEYTYDAWGNVTSITGPFASGSGVMNPFRYRGYFYDNETGLYYLNSRYYNPQWGRFINADGTLLSNPGMDIHNVFAYCGNNPVNLVDPNGTCPNGMCPVFVGRCPVCGKWISNSYKQDEITINHVLDSRDKAEKARVNNKEKAEFEKNLQYYKEHPEEGVPKEYIEYLNTPEWNHNKAILENSIKEIIVDPIIVGAVTAFFEGPGVFLPAVAIDCVLAIKEEFPKWYDLQFVEPDYSLE